MMLEPGRSRRDPRSGAPVFNKYLGQINWTFTPCLARLAGKIIYK